MAFNVRHLPPTVATALRRYDGRKRRLALVRIVCASLATYGIAALVAMHIDRLLFLETGTRVMLAAATHAVGLLMLVGLIARFIITRPTVRQVAYDLENRIDAESALPRPIGERLVTLDSLARQNIEAPDTVNRDLFAQLETEAMHAAQVIRGEKLVRDALIRRRLVQVVLVLAAFLVLWLIPGYQFSLMAQRFAFPNRPLPKPSFVRLEVTPTDVVVGKGGELVMQVKTIGETPAALEWLLDVLGQQPGRAVLAVREAGADLSFEAAPKRDMTRVQRDLFIYSQSELDRDLSLQVRFGDAQSVPIPVRVIEQPRIVDVRLDVTPPAYTALPAEMLTDLTQPVALLPGTRVTLHFGADQPMTERTVAVDPKPEEPYDVEWDDASRRGSVTFMVESKQLLELHVTNADGFANVDPTKVAVTLRSDEPPTVHLDLPSAEVEKVAAEIVPLQAVVEDDLGLSELALRYIVNPSPDEVREPREVPVALTREENGAGDDATDGDDTARASDDAGKPIRRVSIRVAFDLETAGVGPGDVVMLNLRARDTAGNDGLSRPLLIRIVPFTRGENERRRLVVLEFIRQSFERLALVEAARSSAPDTADDKAGATWTDIAAVAQKLSIPLGENAASESLLELLEIEHHLTDASRDKADVRRIRTIVLAARRDATSDSSVDALNLLAGDTMPALIRYRRAKNLAWRLFGMRAEAQAIADRMTDLSVSDPDNADVKAAITRRSTLYLDALQDLGDELITLANDSDAIDADTIKNVIGETNTAGYYLGRGGYSRRIRSAEDLGVALDRATDAMRTALPTLFEAYKASRKALDTRYRADLLACARQAESADDSIRPAALRVLRDDARIVGRNPLAPWWTVVSLDAAARRAAGEPGMASMTDLLAPTGEAVKTVAAEHAMLDRIDYELQLRMLRDNARLTESERGLAQRVLAMEFGAPIEEGQPDPRAAWDAASRGTATLAGIDSLVRERVAFRPPGDALSSVLESFAGTKAALDTAASAIKAGDPAQIQPAAANATAALEYEQAVLEQLIRSLELQLGGQLVAGEQGADDEVLLLALREQLARMQARMLRATATLSAAGIGHFSAADARQLSEDVGRLAFLHDASDKALRALLTDYRGGNLAASDRAQRFALLERFEASADEVAALADLTAPSSEGARADVVRAYFEAQPDMAVSVVATRGKRIADTGVSAIADMHQAVGGETIDRAMLRDAGQLAWVLFEDLSDFADIAGDEPQLAMITANALQLSRRIKSTLDDGNSEASPAQLRLTISEISTEADRLAGAVHGLASTIDHAGVFIGGPVALSQEAYARQRQVAADRNAALADAAQTWALAGIYDSHNTQGTSLSALGAPPVSTVHFRMLRSSLTGVGGVQMPRRDDGGETDMHLEFLRAEIQKARQAGDLGVYDRVTREYLKSVEDYLRY